MMNDPGDKPPFLSGRDAQALKHLTIYADETNAVRDTTQNSYKLLALGKLTSEDILNHFPNVFKPGRGKPLGTPKHTDLDPSVTPAHAPTRRVPAAKTSEDILNHFPNVFKPGRGKPLGTPKHTDL